MPVGDNFDFDVFISYSHKDEEWVTKTLLSRLENADLKVCIDFRDFEPGKAALHNIRDAAKRSQRTLLVMTPNWASSEWTLYESILARTSDPAGLKKRTIPLLLEKCEIPEDISILTYVDFTRPDREDIAWRQLLTALGKPPEQEPPTEPQRGNWYLVHPYPMPPNFTGRAEERKMLTDWLVADAAHPLLVLRALGGFGKSALAWHWLTHDIAHATWPRVVWWSFYEGDASFDHFLAETLYYLSGGKSKPDKLSVNEVKMLTEMLHVPGTLLVLDGFERALRAFGGMNAAYRGDEVANSELNDRDCISPLVENFLCACATLPNIRAKILLTTRLRPCVLEAKGGGFLQGCREEELKQMQPADAVEFFRVQGIRGTHTEIEQACAPYGYHPLSLRLLAGLIVSDFQQPGDIAATKRLDVSGDLVQRKHHVLETAYNSLAPARRVLLARIACFRSPVKYDALRELAIPDSILRKEAHSEKRSEEREKSERNVTLVATTKELDANLRDLVMRGLLHYDTKEGRFDLHPIVRRYVYDRLAAPDRVIAHARLRDYFAAVPKPDKVTRLEDLAPVIELYHHTVRTGQYDEAFTLFRDRLEKATYDHFGAYLLRIDLLCALFPEGENRLPHLKKDSDQAWTLNSLANSYSLSGQPRRAVPMYEASIDIDDRLGDKLNLAIDLENLSYMAQIHIGALRAGDVNLHRSIALCREIKNEFWERGIGDAANLPQRVCRVGNETDDCVDGVRETEGRAVARPRLGLPRSARTSPAALRSPFLTPYSTFRDRIGSSRVRTGG